jgi:predicted phage-related endonuclease
MSDRPNVPVPDELAAIRAELKRLEAREHELKALILANPDIRTGASWLAEVKEVTSNRVDVKELRACYPDLVAEQTHPMTVKQIVLSGIDADTGEIVPARRFRKEQEAA